MRNLSFILLLAISLSATAQKLPNKQEASVWAPANIKIDRKGEWNEGFQAYNHNTDLFYTIANNKDFLYLVIYVQDPAVIETISTYGFTFTVQLPAKKEINKNAFNIKFPLNDSKKLGLLLKKPDTKTDTTESLRRSVMNSNNDILQKRHKMMIVTGVNGIDTISVYNEEGFKTSERFDEERNYTLEVAIPLIYLKSFIEKNATFSYHMLVNGWEASRGSDMQINTPKDGFSQATLQAMAALDARLAKRYARTDFWGEYTLAKAP